MGNYDLLKYHPYIWMNGEIIELENAKISVLTHSLHYSGAVYEGQRAYNGRIFKLREHTERLFKSAKMLYMEIPYTKEKIINANESIIKKNNIKNAYIRPLVWRGSETLNIINSKLSINCMIACIVSSERKSSPLNLHISDWRKASPNVLPVQCKSSGHYNMMIIAQSAAKSKGYDDALMLDWRGYVAECTTSNVFFAKENTLVTPITDACLNGITRQTIIELAVAKGMNIVETHIKIADLHEYNECFITGTAAEIKAVASIDIGKNKLIFTSTKITNTLEEEYKNLIVS